MNPTEVILSKKAYEKIMYWVDRSPIEISGLGKLIFEDGKYIVTDAFLVKQKNTAASTEMDGASIAKLMFETKDIPGHLNFWWHSHVNMGVFWSGTDTQTMRDLGGNGFLVSTVFNKKKEMRSAIYYRESEIMPRFFVDGIKTTVEEKLDSELIAFLNQEYLEKCEDERAPSIYLKDSWRYSQYWPEDTQTDWKLPESNKESVTQEDYELLNWEFVNQKCLAIEGEKNKDLAVNILREAYRTIKDMKVDKLTKKAMREELEIVFRESRKVWNQFTSSDSKTLLQKRT